MKKLNNVLLKLFVTASIAVESAAANANLGLGDIGRAQVTTFTGLSEAAFYGSLFGGVALGIGGLLQIANAHKKQESIKPGVTMLIVGGALASIVAVISSGSTTIFGTDSTQTTRLGM